MMNQQNETKYHNGLWACLMISWPTKLTSSPLNCWTRLAITNVSSKKPIGPNRASGRMSKGDTIYNSMRRITLTRGLVIKYPMPSEVSNLGASLMNVPNYSIDLINWIYILIPLVNDHIWSCIHKFFISVSFVTDW